MMNAVLDRLNKADALLLALCGPDGVDALENSQVVDLIALAVELVQEAKAGVTQQLTMQPA